MSSAYDQQIKKLIDHIQTLNHALHERNMQIVQWQQVARAVQDERARISRSLLDMIKTALAGFAQRFQSLRTENKKLRSYVDHQRQLHEVVARDLQGQLQYALQRIDELAAERADWRQEVSTTRNAATRHQQSVAEQRGVIDSQAAAVAELKRQLEKAMRFSELEDQYKAEMRHMNDELATLKSQLASQDHAVAGKDRELGATLASFENFKIRAAQEVQAMQLEVSAARNSMVNVDERVDEMTKLLANSEREVAKLFKDLSEERTLRKEAEIRLEAASKDLRKAKTAVTKMEKAEKAAKGEQITDLQKRFDEMAERAAELQDQLAKALSDKTAYMQAVEGTKGKLKALQPPPAEGGKSP